MGFENIIQFVRRKDLNLTVTIDTHRGRINLKSGFAVCLHSMMSSTEKTISWLCLPKNLLKKILGFSSVKNERFVRLLAPNSSKFTYDIGQENFFFEKDVIEVILTPGEFRTRNVHAVWKRDFIAYDGCATSLVFMPSDVLSNEECFLYSEISNQNIERMRRTDSGKHNQVVGFSSIAEVVDMLNITGIREFIKKSSEEKTSKVHERQKIESYARGVYKKDADGMFRRKTFGEVSERESLEILFLPKCTRTRKVNLYCTDENEEINQLITTTCAENGRPILEDLRGNSSSEYFAKEILKKRCEAAVGKFSVKKIMKFLKMEEIGEHDGEKLYELPGRGNVISRITKMITVEDGIEEMVKRGLLVGARGRFELPNTRTETRIEMCRNLVIERRRSEFTILPIREKEPPTIGLKGHDYFSKTVINTSDREIFVFLKFRGKPAKTGFLNEKAIHNLTSSSLEAVHTIVAVGCNLLILGCLRIKIRKFLTGHHVGKENTLIDFGKLLQGAHISIGKSIDSMEGVKVDGELTARFVFLHLCGDTSFTYTYSKKSQSR